MKKLLKPFGVTIIVALCAITTAKAERAAIGGAQVVSVAVNGGVDTVNPGTTCIKVDLPVATQCTHGYIGIPKNNSDLVRAALVAKSSKSKVWVYYDFQDVEYLPHDTGHCPGLVFTKCSLISLMLTD